MGTSEIATLVKQNVDIVDVVSQVVPLRRIGNRHAGLCPFHQEKSPSFYVDADNQLYHCFGCGSGGDVLNFVMRHRNVSFIEAVEYLADRYHINLPQLDQARQLSGAMAEASRKEREELYSVIKVAADYYYQQLHHSQGGKAARDYITLRALPAHVVETETIGYAPNRWDGLLVHMDSLGIDAELGIKAGLLTKNVKDRVFDRFRNRLMFPIRDDRNRIIAFGGRILSGGSTEQSLDAPSAGHDEAKYLNSPETPLFHKGRMLYQLARARGECRESRQVVMVEGYMDLLAFHAYDFYRVVATLGTALTAHQVRLLSRFVDEVILAYDGDDAGERAMLRALPLFLQEEVTVTCIHFPHGMDPDDFLKEKKLSGFESLIRQRQDLGVYTIRKAIDGWDGSLAGKTKIIAELQPVIDSVRQPVLKSEYLRLIADRLSLSEELVQRQLHHGKRNAAKYTRSAHAIAPVQIAQDYSLEERIVRSMIKYPDLIEDVMDSGAVSCFEESRLKSLAEAIIRAPHIHEGSFNASAIYDSLEDSETKELFTRFLLESGDLSEARIHIRDWLEALRKSKTERQHLASLKEALRRAQSEGDAIKVRNLLAQLQSLHSAKKRVKGTPENV